MALIPERLFYLHQKQILFPPTDFYLGFIAHDHQSALTPLVFLYVVHVDQERFMDPEKRSVLQDLVIFEQGF